MSITVTCPHCGTTTNVSDQFAGQTGPCKNCGNKVTVPYPMGTAAAPVKSSSSVAVIVGIAVASLFVLLLCAGVLAALLLPAVQAAREAARRTECSNNLKQIALALHNYHDRYNSLPPAYTVDAGGKPLHSWRTLLLPYLEQQALYDQIDLNEPWDSPKNKPFSEMRVPVYICPSSPEGAACSYMVIVGEGTPFPGSKQVSFSQIKDGLSNTLMVVETNSNARSWMEPVDLDLNQMQFKPNQGPSQGGSKHPGGFNCTMCDGAGRFISDSIDPTTFKNLTTIDDGTVISGY